MVSYSTDMHSTAGAVERENNINILFYMGAMMSILISIVPVVVFKKIKKHIKELGELDG